MSSYRAQVNNAMKAALLGQTVAQQSVFTSLDRPLHPSDLPAIIVYAQGARRGPQDYGNSLIPRMLDVTIECAVQAAPETAQAQADALVDAIEELIEADPTLGNVVQNTVWQRSLSDVASHGTSTLGVGLLQYEVTILTSERLPEAFGIGDDGFTGTPTVVYTLPDVTGPGLFQGVQPDPSAPCGPEGCDLPAWGGEVQP